MRDNTDDKFIHNGLGTIHHSRVIVRVCWDVPSLDDTIRIDDSLETISTLLDQNNVLVVISHWGRPHSCDVHLSLKRLVPIFEQHLNLKRNTTTSIAFASSIESALDLQQRTNAPNVIVLENIRFFPQETSSDISERAKLAAHLSMLGDVMVDEAFAVSHRQTASNDNIKDILPWTYGISYEKELRGLNTIKKNPSRPLIIVLGGAKLETKLPIIKTLSPIADHILLGGLPCFTFMAAQGTDIGNSYVEETYIETARKLLAVYPNVFVLPKDVVYDNGKGVDIGIDTAHEYSTLIEKAGTVFWNGPMGYVEGGFATGTTIVAQAITKNKGYRAIAGGDTISCLSPTELSSISFISMGGGASLSYLAA